MLSSHKEYLLRAERPVPRYTSYPTAPHFQSGFTTRDYRSWLESLDAGQPVSLYIHIPFCPALCWFCGCHTKITQRYAPVADYIDLLIKEIELASACVPHKLSVGHIHFGGGSPTIARTPDFQRVMKTLGRHFDILDTAERAIEIDPRQLSEAKIAIYAKCGVNRASLGVQDFDPTVMAAVNRPQPFASTFEAVTTLRNYGIRHINMDIMYGLPHQTLDTMGETVDRIVSLEPERLSLFGYAHVPWMKKHMRLIPSNALPDASLRYDLFACAREKLIKAGYTPIGIDHFARPDDPLSIAAVQGNLHRNFQGYTDDPCATMIGFGASAISRLPQGFVQNTPHMPQYRDKITAGEMPVEKNCILSAEDRLRGAVIERLMCDFQVDVRTLCIRYGFTPDHLDASLLRLAPLTKEELVHVTPDGQVTVMASQAARLVAAEFDAYLTPPSVAAPRHATSI